jgi:hypothetical protein
VLGHGDWYPENLRWRGTRLLVAYDWDSLIADSEAVVAGLAAAVYPTLHAGGEATVTETQDFLAAYAAARARQFCSDELQRCWAAGVWLRAFDAKKQYAAGQPVRTLTEQEANGCTTLACAEHSTTVTVPLRAGYDLMPHHDHWLIPRASTPADLGASEETEESSHRRRTARGGK